MNKSLLQASHDRKDAGNSFFGKASYDEAIQNYDKALSFCPNYLEYEIAVLRSNISACYIKLEDWKNAVDSATKSLDCLERLDPTTKLKSSDTNTDPTQGVAHRVEEVDDVTAERIDALGKSGRSHSEVNKLRIKVLLRRGKARTEMGGWSSLQGADEGLSWLQYLPQPALSLTRIKDYKQLATMQELSSTDRRIVDSALRQIQPQLSAAKEHEMGEMMGKLKDLGNGILKPFGLSTNNFNFVKDDKTGGYSMQFNQGK